MCVGKALKYQDIAIDLKTKIVPLPTMTHRRTFNAFISSALVTWKSTGKLQQTIAKCVERTGRALHSGKITTVKIWPEHAGGGRYFDFRSKFIPASIEFAEESPLCTTLSKDGHRIRTVEHLLSCLEATGVDNCRIEIENEDSYDQSVEVGDKKCFRL
ncbi:unnamed protein product [Ilex paraguariensis]|uniref:UDP-3-O-acyl-N-acetylglucosamine deacetylase n=1 Tax=Ilex paraguariensis TaxID=185542 RepID=A0ABC8RU93_9AQUA